MTLGRSRRSTISHDKYSPTSIEFYSRRKPRSSQILPSHDQQRFDEDGYLSPLQIKAQVNQFIYYLLFGAYQPVISLPLFSS
jgi:hypothetical protein